MPIDRKTVKRYAKNLVYGNKLTYFLMRLIIYAVEGVTGGIITFVSGAGSLISTSMMLTGKPIFSGTALGWLFLAWLIPAFVNSWFIIGQRYMALSMSHKKRPSIEKTFIGFKERFRLRAFLLWLTKEVFAFIWSFLLIIPGIIKQVAYSQAEFILIDNPGISGNDARKLSEKWMQGHKAEYFLFELSFIPQYLLVGITMGIYGFWAYPYIDIARAVWYRKLKMQHVRGTRQKKARRRENGRA